jgi:hypothetical protein
VLTCYRSLKQGDYYGYNIIQSGYFVCGGRGDACGYRLQFIQGVQNEQRNTRNQWFFQFEF